MNRRHCLVIAAAAFAAILGTEVSAAENLDCVESGYGPAEQKILDDYVANFSMTSWSQHGPPNDVMAAIVGRAQSCAALNDWSPAAAQHAVMFKMARVGLAGVKNSGLTAQDILRLENAITPSDKMKVRTMFAAMAKAAGEGKLADMPAESPDMFIGKLILRSGVYTTPEKNMAAGGWIATIVLSELYAEYFAAD